MDLYEALKRGTSVEDLTRTFQKELDAAKEKIAAEQKQKQKKEAQVELLNVCRYDLAEAILDYAAALVGEEFEEVSADDIDQMLLDFEASLENMSGVGSLLFGTLKSAAPKRKKSDKYVDDQILKEFIKQFK